ncbi:GDP-mannose 4,6-dehydratase [Nocardioides sp. SYSU D00038]|uniref:GDP-mannose 4,6-dehydratase n=1 Tax=Nocardioides sp. SYSU D00038 TaxID=2812554 RepID=UPI001967EBA9|nr:GDP-mannose 4,6-dehydratase [Nocardioides sp. SYSU D00038]
MSTALVTGVAGQDGVYLAHRLLAMGTRVVGTTRPGSGSAAAMAPYLDGVLLEECDLRDAEGFAALLERHRPDRVFNLGGFTSVGASWDQPELVAEVNGAAVERMLAAVRDHRDRTGDDVRFLQAASAEEHGDARSPYAESKARAREAVRRARSEHGLFACAGVLHNHESPLRPARFVTRKITTAAAAIALGRQERLRLGTLEVARDWGAARDHVEALRLMLDLPEPRDLVVATGVTHTLRDLVEQAFAAAGVDDAWARVDHDPALVRPQDSAALAGDPGEAERLLGWRATTSFEDVVRTMVEVDLERLRTGVAERADYAR